MTTPRPQLTRELVRTACLAPSVGNTQPWSWRIVADDHLELYADRSRQMVTLDPSGRELVLSCGAALHHLMVAAIAFGVSATVVELPRPDVPDLLAEIRLGPGEVTDDGPDLLAAIENRHTDRRGASDWPVPVERVQRFAAAASAQGGRVVVLADGGDAARAEHLVETARQAQLADPVAVTEQDAWLDRPEGDGVPGAVADPSDHLEPHRPATRFSRHAPARDPKEEHPELMALLATETDDPAGWLCAGRTLSAFWLAATRGGLAVTPTTQVVEVDATREALREDLLDGAGYPQILVRVGWPAAEASRPTTRRTARRSLDEVLRT